MIKLHELVPASLNKTFGNVFLGGKPKRNLTKGAGPINLSNWQQGKFEPNTPEEDELIYILQSHIGADYRQHPELLAYLPALQTLLKDNPWLAPKEGEELYRGTFITDKKVIEKAIQLHDEEPEKELLRVPVNYTSRTKIQSWSTDDTIADSFCWRHIQRMDNKDDGLPCILYARYKPSMNFFFPDEVLYAASATQGSIESAESEVLHFGNNPITCTALIHLTAAFRYKRLLDNK
jgi:hypothetical protein